MLLRDVLRFFLLFIVSQSILLSSSIAKTQADIGVGVGTGKIEVNEQLESGKIYTLPQIIVYNTGDETATYAMQLTLNETQDERKPSPDWFSFSPAAFELEPGKSNLVTPTITVPINAEGGDYFGYLEAYPDTTVESQGAAIGVAAATKLSFSITPSNSFIGIINRLVSLYNSYAPISYILTVILVVLMIILIMRRYVSLNVTVSKNAKKTKKESDEDKESDD